MPSRDPIRHGINQRLKDSSWYKYAFNALEILGSEPKLSINLENGKNAIFHLSMFTARVFELI
jgi:hypothetical protein